MDLEIVILSEVSQTERQISYDISYMWNLKKMAQMKLQNRSRVTDVENKFMAMKGEKRGDKLGDWD